ncbi:hypothetical protein GI364_06680 [Alicyclobacillus sp. SO9]|nr:hypothetical protein GI364_06680 [Alicyclobacillus sp. SO9]
MQRLRAEALDTDKEDLLAIFELRFGGMPESVKKSIHAIDDGTKLERLVLVAANVPVLSKFMEELGQGTEAFRIVGEDYNPLSQP